MTAMGHGQHEFEQERQWDRFLWPAAVIAACVMLEVWASWLQIGSVSGFPKFGGMTTGWILPVSTEAYWSCALFAWLAGAPGSASRKFAMWSAAGMFVLSLGGQESAHLLEAGRRAAPPAVVVGFVSALPLVSLALIALLVHLRHADREKAVAVARAAAQAAREAALERAEADERTALRAELETARGTLEAERRARTDAQQEAARLASAEAERAQAVTARDDALAAAESAQGALADAERRAARAEDRAARADRKTGAHAGPRHARTGSAAEAPAGRTQLEIARDARAKAEGILAERPGISGAELAAECGMKERWGQTVKKQVAERSLGETG